MKVNGHTVKVEPSWDLDEIDSYKIDDGSAFGITVSADRAGEWTVSHASGSGSPEETLRWAAALSTAARIALGAVESEGYAIIAAARDLERALSATFREGDLADETKLGMVRAIALNHARGITPAQRESIERETLRSTRVTAALDALEKALAAEVTV